MTVRSPAMWRLLVGRLGPLAVPLALASGAHAAPLFDHASLERKVGASDIVFLGVVDAIEEAGSHSDNPARPPVPHTFVTYRIDELFKGRAAGSELTLRFPGGLTDEGIDFHVSGVPSVEVGDQDLLFVRKNCRRAVPLVGWSQGRMRVIEGGVFDDRGEVLSLDSDDRLRYRHRDDCVHGTMASSERTCDEEQAQRTTLSLSDLAAAIDRAVETVHTPAELAALPVVASANPGRPFPSLLDRPAPPPREQLFLPPPPNGQEDPELALIRANGGNPVLPAQRLANKEQGR